MPRKKKPALTLAKDIDTLINYQAPEVPATRDSEAAYFGLSDTYWNGLSEQSRAVMRLVRPLPPGDSSTVHLGHLENWLSDQQQTAAQMGGTFDLNPDFQRGHVWTPEQQQRFIESFLRGVAPKELRFNCPAYDHHNRAGGDINPYDFVCVDGLQRLTALRHFLAGGVKVFGEIRAEDLRGTPFDPFRMTMYVTATIHSLNRRADLLKMYLDINNGGSAHTEAEIERVRALLAAAS